MSHRDQLVYDEHEPYHDEPEHSDSNSAATDELEEEEEEEEDCPLCMEHFDATDKEFTPCKCGYKICLYCWDSLNNIYTNTSSSSASSLLSSSSSDRPPLAGRCPACRQPYQYPELTINAAALQSSLRAKQQRSAHRDKHKRANSSASASLATSASATTSSTSSDAHGKSSGDNNTRVLQRNLMYVSNLPASVAKEELLEDKRYFGKFGKIVKIAITRKSGGGNGGGAWTAYVTFKRAADCAVALQLCHHTLLLGLTVKCMYGTTKYCPFWLRSVPCTMNRCGYLHAVANQEDVVGKEELQAMEKKGDGEKPLPFPLQTTVSEALAAAKAHKAVQPADEADLPTPASSSTASSSSAPAASATVTPPASVWKLPAAPAISTSTSTSLASIAASALSSSSAAAAASSTSSSSSTSASLRPYVSILAQSQSATHSPPSSTATLPLSSVSNEIIRIVPSYLKDRFTPSTTPSAVAQPGTAATAPSSGRRKHGSTSSTATASPALSPLSTASSITASPSMSRSTSKASASSASSRASSPVPSPLLQPTDPSSASLSQSPPPPAPHSARSVISPLPPAALSPAASVTSIASSVSSEQQPLAVAAAVPLADEYQFDFLLYSQFDFSSFFSSYAADDPLFSWLCTPSHTAVHPFARARLSQQPRRSSESMFDFARAGAEDEDEQRGAASGKSVGSAGGAEEALSKQADSAWNEQKVDPASGEAAAAVVQQVGGRRLR